MSSASLIQRVSPESLPPTGKKILERELMTMLAPIDVEDSGYLFGEVVPNRIHLDPLRRSRSVLSRGAPSQSLTKNLRQ